MMPVNATGLGCWGMIDRGGIDCIQRREWIGRIDNHLLLPPSSSGQPNPIGFGEQIGDTKMTWRMEGRMQTKVSQAVIDKSSVRSDLTEWKRLLGW